MASSVKEKDIAELREAGYLAKDGTYNDMRRTASPGGATPLVVTTNHL